MALPDSKKSFFNNIYNYFDTDWRKCHFNIAHQYADAWQQWR